MKILRIDEDAFFLKVFWRSLARLRFPGWRARPPGSFGTNSVNRVESGAHLKSTGGHLMVAQAMRLQRNTRLHDDYANGPARKAPLRDFSFGAFDALQENAA